MMYTQYETFQPNQSKVINISNNVDTMYTISKLRGLNYETPFILLNICKLNDNSFNTNVILRPNSKSITKNVIVLNGGTVMLLDCYGNISQFVSNTTNLGQNVINLKNEDINCSYIGLQLDFVSIDKIIQYFNYVEIQKTEQSYAPIIYFFIIVGVIILFMIIVIIFTIAMINLDSIKKNNKSE